MKLPDRILQSHSFHESSRIAHWTAVSRIDGMHRHDAWVIQLTGDVRFPLKSCTSGTGLTKLLWKLQRDASIQNRIVRQINGPESAGGMQFLNAKLGRHPHEWRWFLRCIRTISWRGCGKTVCRDSKF